MKNDIMSVTEVTVMEGPKYKINENLTGFFSCYSLTCVFHGQCDPLPYWQPTLPLALQRNNIYYKPKRLLFSFTRFSRHCTMTNMSSTPMPMRRKGTTGWRSAQNRPR